jgi:hypothetical protein
LKAKPKFKGSLKCSKCRGNGYSASDCRSGMTCTTCGKPGHDAASCKSTACSNCGKHYPRSDKHHYSNCTGYAGNGAFLGNVCRMVITYVTDMYIENDNNSIHSDDKYVANTNDDGFTQWRH